jgi:hypothetical protein
MPPTVFIAVHSSELARLAQNRGSIVPDPRLSRLSSFPLGRFRGFAQGFVIGHDELDMTHAKCLCEVV